MGGGGPGGVAIAVPGPSVDELEPLWRFRLTGVAAQPVVATMPVGIAGGVNLDSPVAMPPVDRRARRAAGLWLRSCTCTRPDTLAGGTPVKVVSLGAARQRGAVSERPPRRRGS